MSKLSLDCERLTAAYRNGVTTPERVIGDVLERIASAGDDHVWLSRPNDAVVLEQARSLTRRGAQSSHLPLYGLPFGVKDSIDVAAMPTTLACPAYSYTPAKTAAVVQRLIEAGAVFIGKTNLDQFATGLVGVRSGYGIPRNPFDAAMIPGGSSSGSAVAVASGLVSFAVATDTAGSGRVPAAFNNIVGYKPTRGLFSMSGLVPACRSVDCITVMALTVGDAMRVAKVMGGFDANDPYSRYPPQGFTLDYGRASKSFRFGVPKRAQLQFFGDVEAERLFEVAVARAIALGGELAEVDYEPFNDAASLLYGPWVAERTADLGEFIAAHPNDVNPVVREIILDGKKLGAAELFRAEHRLAELKRAISPIWDTIDFLLLPTTGTIYSIEEVLAEPIARNTNLGYYTNFTNLLDMAGIAIPSSFRAKALPVGITLIGPAWSDVRLASFADGLQRAAGLTLGATGVALPERQASPSKVVEAGNDTQLEIVVFGAHMRGEPLNHELIDLGASFSRSCRTAPLYRMYALDGTIARPALTRADAGGRSLEGELWSLPTEAMGTFLARIKSPLGLGKVVLADESVQIGFICEAGAIGGARDISEFGGWRGYRASSQSTD
jgi:allophanate hydrolase